MSSFSAKEEDQNGETEQTKQDSNKKRKQVVVRQSFATAQREKCSKAGCNCGSRKMTREAKKVPEYNSWVSGAERTQMVHSSFDELLGGKLPINCTEQSIAIEDMS